MQGRIWRNRGRVAGGILLTMAAVVRARGAMAAEVPLPPPPQAAPLSDEAVTQAIHRGVEYLLKDLAQKSKAIQELPVERRTQPGAINEFGELMLETYALLHVGADTQDPRLRYRDEKMATAVDVLIHKQEDSTYATALQSLALAELPQSPEVTRAIARAADRLVRGSGSAGGYTYQIDAPSRDTHDQSNSQYGLLGVWAAADWGVKIPLHYWKHTDDFWRAMQTPQGGWGYGTNGPTEPPRNTMTAAGVASLYVCNEFLDRIPRLKARPDAVLESGLTALVDGFTPASTDFYYLYGVERVGLASGLKYLGRTNWYRETTLNMLKLQQPDGSFSASFVGANAVRSTCYGLLFLVRGRAPVLMNKLSYDGPWNARPRDSANVHAHLGRMLERHLNWQIVPLEADPTEWLDAPILLITGSQDPHFSDDDVAKFRRFVEAGGIIFSTADGNSPEFSAAMKRYATAVAGPGREYRMLPEDHPLFTVYGKADTATSLYGVSNGVREMWIHSPLDFGAIWQARQSMTGDAWELPARLFFYAAGKAGLRSKLQSLTVPDAETPPKTIPVVQLQYDGNWNAEPGAWPRLSKLMAIRGGAGMALSNVKLAELGALSPRPALAHLAGTGKLTLTEAEEVALSVYVQTGGTLFVEAMRGDAEFAASARELLAKLFPQSKLKVIPRNYLLYNGDISPAATKIDEVEYRKYWLLAHGALSTPRVESLAVGGRLGVFFSGEDITSGLLGTNTWGIGGYMPGSAIAIARNMVLFSSINAPRK